MQNIYNLHEGTKFPCKVCDFKTSARLSLTRHNESLHETTQFFVRYLTEQIKKRKQIQNIYMKKLNFLVGYVILKQVPNLG